MTIVSSASTLKTLMALYENENASSGGSSKLTPDQATGIETMLEGSATSASSSSDTLDTLLGTSTTSSDDLTSILDGIQSSNASGTDATTTSDTTTATPQQKAAAVMQSIYQSQQTNLFTLIG